MVGGGSRLAELVVAHHFDLAKDLLNQRDVLVLRAMA